MLLCPSISGGAAADPIAVDGGPFRHRPGRATNVALYRTADIDARPVTRTGAA
ncbi:hypothetical protein OG949_39310 [Streptomyces scopuliridis]|uniref:hypothetical protein n=1 Tax=Streptomyces scopuliridis TaxID=452529 RepID=UPI002DDC327F|nr:hypothetical protein [Streptomyces scopuliridis]WSB38280.1 hypothetical protein OG949_39310 [Streptomyces scopuliridis]